MAGVSRIFNFFREVQSGHYLIYHMWLHQADSFIILYLNVEPKEFLQVSLNGQEKIGSLEVLDDLVNLLLARTINY